MRSPGKKTVARISSIKVSDMRFVPGVCLLLLASSLPAAAGIFDDQEARKEIAELQRQTQQQNQAVDARFEKLESSIKNLGLVELISQIETLNADINKLRGQIEVQNNQIETAQKRQREFYLDLDTRMRALEQPGASAKDKDSTGVKERDVAATGGATGVAPPKDDKAASEAATKPPGAPGVSAPGSSTPGKPQAGAVPSSSAAPATAGLTPPVATLTKPSGRDANSADSKSYDEAYKVFKSGNYQAAIVDFNKFVGDYPNSLLAPNALYWTGVSYMNQRDYKSALATHQNLLRRYPDSPKIPDAMLNVSTIQSEQGDSGSARNTLEDIVKNYPQSEAAAKARSRLAQKK